MSKKKQKEEPKPKRSKEQNSIMKFVALSDITIGKTNPRREFDERELTELSHSIKQKGVLQPILIRPNGKAGKFELVCGERRYKASKLAGLKEIPVNIREFTDEEALDAQLTENLQRKDVHPMDEAIAFNSLLNRYADRNAGLLELALRFGKSTSFIAQRIKLNNLIPELKKDFYLNKFSLGHAILFARLEAQFQKEAREDIMSNNHRTKETEYNTISELQDFIDQNIMHNLSSVPFKKDDATLIPKAGPCTTCPKRSGANPSLFPEIKKDDRCFDPECFQKKSKAFVMIRLKDTLENHPEILLAREMSDCDEEINKLAASYKVKILREYTDWSEPSAKQKTAKALILNGNNEGKIIQIYLHKVNKEDQEAMDGSPTAQLDLEIAGIKQRQDRAQELDNEKVYVKILQSLKQHPSQSKVTSPMTEPEERALWWHLIQELGWDDLVEDKILKCDPDDEDKFDKIYDRIGTLTPEEKAYILRQAFINKHGSSENGTPIEEMFVRKIVLSYGDIPIADYEKEQLEVRTKRLERANKRISDLQKQKKDVATAAPAKKGKGVKALLTDAE